MRFGVLLLVVAVVMVGPNGCREAEPPENLLVVASIFPLADFVRNVGGDLIQVEVLIPGGASPHTYEPTPRQVEAVSRSRLFVKIGLGLELWAEKVLSAAGPELRVLEVSQGVEVIKGDEQGHRGVHRDHGNPHIWLDPIIAKAIVSRIEEALVEIDSAHTAIYRHNGQQYRSQLDSLDQQIRKRIANFKTHQFVAFHPAWAYFARRYGLEQVAVIEPAPGKEPTPTHVAEVAQVLEQIDARALFAEPQLNPKVADAIARETGIPVLMLDPLGHPNQQDRDSYLKLMETNLSVMEEAMG